MRQVLFYGIIALLCFLMGIMVIYLSCSLRKKCSNKPKPFCYDVCSTSEPYPRPRILKNFLSKEECELLKKKSDEIGFSESLVGDYQKDKNRTSKTCWVYPEKTPFLKYIYDRVYQIPEIKALKENVICEPCQVVQYLDGQEYKAHYDQCHKKETYCMDQISKWGGPRKWTLLMYISDNCEGGETYFPNLNIKVKPKQGDAVLFTSLSEDNSKVHPLSYHQGSPVVTGEKRIANVWIRVREPLKP